MARAKRTRQEIRSVGTIPRFSFHATCIISEQLGGFDTERAAQAFRMRALPIGWGRPSVVPSAACRLYRYALEHVVSIVASSRCFSPVLVHAEALVLARGSCRPRR